MNDDVQHVKFVFLDTHFILDRVRISMLIISVDEFESINPGLPLVFNNFRNSFVPLFTRQVYAISLEQYFL